MSDETEQQRLASEQQAQIDQAVRRSLSYAGIGKTLHDLKISSFGEGGQLIAAHAADPVAFRMHFIAGCGYSLECLSYRSSDAAYALARSMVLKSVKVRVVSLFDLLRYVDDQNGDYSGTPLDEFERAQAVVIPGFYAPQFFPFKAEKVSYLEYYLTNRVQDGFSVSVQYEGTLEGQTVWSSRFCKLLAEKNRKVVLE